MLDLLYKPMSILAILAILVNSTYVGVRASNVFLLNEGNKPTLCVLTGTEFD